MLKNIFYFPLLVFKGIYHTGHICSFFPGGETANGMLCCQGILLVDRFVPVDPAQSISFLDEDLSLGGLTAIGQRIGDFHFLVTIKVFSTKPPKKNKETKEKYKTHG